MTEVTAVRFDDVPDDIYSSILAFLPSKDAVRCSLVSRRWNLLCHQLQILFYNCPSAPESAIVSTIANQQHLKHLVVVQSEKLSTSGLEQIMESQASSLINLTLYECTFKELSVPAAPRIQRLLIKMAAKLRELNIADCGPQRLQNLSLTGCQKLTEANISQIYSSGFASTVEEVSLGGCQKGGTDASLDVITQHCTRITKLDLQTLVSVSDAGLEYVASRLTSLQELSCLFVPAITDKSLISLGKHHNPLKSIDLGQCTAITDAGIIALAEGCPTLERVLLGGCSLLTDNAALALATHCPNLKEVDFSNTLISSEGIRALGRNCPSIHTLNIHHCSRLNNEALHAIATLFPRLKCLDLSDPQPNTATGVLASASGAFTAQGFIPFCDPTMSVLSELKEFRAHACPFITSESLAHMKTAPFRHSIRRLELSRCSALTDAGVVSIASSCRNLKHAVFLLCTQLTDASVDALCKACPALNLISLANCKQVTDASLKSVAQSRSVRTLYVPGCASLTSQGLLSLAEDSTTLELLYARNCPKIKIEAIREVKAKLPKLTVKTS